MVQHSTRLDSGSLWMYRGIGLAGLIGVRVLLWLAYHPTPIPWSPISDPLIYSDLANGWMAGEPWPEEALYHSPLYPYLLGGLFRLFGPSPYSMILLQNAAGILSGMLLLEWLLRTSKRRSRFWVGLVLLVQSGVWISYEWKLFPVTLAITAQIVIVGLLGLHFRGDSSSNATWKRWTSLTVVGGSLALLILLRSNFLLLLPLFYAAPLIPTLRRRIGVFSMVYVALFATILLVPFLLRNEGLGGGYSLSANSGITFYQGNNEAASGIYTKVAGVSTDILRQNSDARRVARSQGYETVSEANRYWFSQGLEWIRTDPSRAVRLWMKKAFLFFGPQELSGDFPFQFERERILSLRLSSLVNFTFLSVFGLVGLWVLRREWEWWGPFALFVIASFSTCVIFYVNGRYRIPVWPLLIPPAAVGIDRLGEWSRTDSSTAHPNRRFAGAAAFVAGIALIGFTLPVDLSRPQMVIGWHNWGVASARASLDDEAVRAYEKVLAIRAGHVPTLENLSRLHLKRRDADRAEATLNRLLRHAPNSYLVHKGMADLRFQQMDWPDARRAADRALAIRPGNRQAQLILAGASIRLHDYESACPILERLDLVETLDGSFYAMLNACRRLQRAASRPE